MADLSFDHHSHDLRPFFFGRGSIESHTDQYILHILLYELLLRFIHSLESFPEIQSVDFTRFRDL